MTLLEKAKSSTKRMNEITVDHERMELGISYMKGEVSNG